MVTGTPLPHNSLGAAILFIVLVFSFCFCPQSHPCVAQTAQLVAPGLGLLGLQSELPWFVVSGLFLIFESWSVGSAARAGLELLALPASASKCTFMTCLESNIYLHVRGVRRHLKVCGTKPQCSVRVLGKEKKQLVCTGKSYC